MGSGSVKIQKPQKSACLFPSTVLYFLLFAEAGGYLGVAQLGSVLEWGSRGREFESLHPDGKALENEKFSRVFACLSFWKIMDIV